MDVLMLPKRDPYLEVILYYCIVLEYSYLTGSTPLGEISSPPIVRRSMAFSLARPRTSDRKCESVLQML